MRLDEFLYLNNYFDSRTKSNQAIKRGEVYVNGKLTDKPSFLITEDIPSIEIKSQSAFVSLGGYKLQKALKDFNLNPNGLVCADVGASTGGFTDCLLQGGAKKVFAVDLNDTLLHPNLKKDDRVVSIIKNARYVNKTDFNEKIDFITADLSFISETVVLPVFYNLLDFGGRGILLIKPQFEQDKKTKVKNGVLKDKVQLLNACKKIYDFSVQCGFSVKDLTVAPIVKNKNVEFLIYIEKSNADSPSFEILFNKCNKF